MFDIIGDIHGHADKLEELLFELGYTKSNGSYAHSERKALFVGDYIDRGPKIPETLRIVKGMVDSGNAIALMGNHEYNALCFHIHHPQGGHLRPHSIKNIHQHYTTLRSFHGKQHELENYLEWFKSLPLFYEDDQLRAVHACWNENNIQLLKNIVNTPLTDAQIYDSSIIGNTLYRAFDQTLKGIELTMPAGMDWQDHEMNVRTEIRTRWWENPLEMTYREISVESIEALPEIPVDRSCLPTVEYYSNTKPVFFGHYWLNGMPQLLKNNVCCVDYSIAKGGKLVAYRQNLESTLDNRNFIFV